MYVWVIWAKLLTLSDLEAIIFGSNSLAPHPKKKKKKEKEKTEKSFYFRHKQSTGRPGSRSERKGREREKVKTAERERRQWQGQHARTLKHSCTLSVLLMQPLLQISRLASLSS